MQCSFFSAATATGQSVTLQQQFERVWVCPRYECSFDLSFMPPGASIIV